MKIELLYAYVCILSMIEKIPNLQAFLIHAKDKSFSPIPGAMSIMAQVAIKLTKSQFQSFSFNKSVIVNIKMYILRNVKVCFRRYIACSFVFANPNIIIWIEYVSRIFWKHFETFFLSNVTLSPNIQQIKFCRHLR